MISHQQPSPVDILNSLTSTVVATPAATINDQLERKQEELQLLINHQQDELRRVSEQLMTARYSLVNSVSVPILSSPLIVSSNIVPHMNELVSSQNSGTETLNHQHHTHHHQLQHHHSHSQSNPHPHYPQAIPMGINPHHQASTIVSNYDSNNPLVYIDLSNEEYPSYMQLTPVSSIQVQQNSQLINHQQTLHSRQPQQQQPQPQPQTQQHPQQHPQQHHYYQQ